MKQAKAATRTHALNRLTLTFSFLGLTTLLLLIMQNVHATENLFEKHYKAQSTYQLQSMQVNPETKMYVSEDKQADNISMLEDGYDMMGSTGFEYAHIAPELALAHAKSIKADVVLLYTRHAAKSTGDSRMALIKEAAKTGKELTEKDVAEPEEQYKYYASYWAKIPAPLFGVHIIKLKSKQSASQGLKVLAVIKDSPAAKAGLKHGDVILSIANQAVEKPELLAGIVHAHQGKTVDVVYSRNAEEQTAIATINQR